MKRSYSYMKYLIGFAAIAALVMTGCHHKTPEQRAERVVQQLVSTLDLNAAQTEKLQKMKAEFLAQRPDMGKARAETLADLREMMLSPQVDEARLNSRREKVQAHADDMIKFLFARFTELHDLLTPEQRSKLVAEMEKHAERHHRW
jgi:Spy/CpxP family protein refolding chaperone